MSEVVTLASIGGGACLELFEREMQSVMRNIADLNTSAATKRKITIEVTITPDDNRQVGFTSVQVTSKLAGVKPVMSTLYFGARKDGTLVAVTNNPAQPSMFDEQEQPAEDVVPMRVFEGGKGA